MNMPGRDNPGLTNDEIAALARDVESHDFDRIAPPPMVWDKIRTELQSEFSDHDVAASHDSPDSPPAPQSISRGRFTPARLLSIAAATLLMVGVAVAVVSNAAEDTSVTEFAAAMTNEGLPVSTAETANASVFCEDSGCYVEVMLSDLPDAGGDNLELWVINGDISDMHSLGNVTNNSGRFDLPPDVTAEDFPIVDISIEPNDGDETHSGQSVLRGELSQP